MKYTRFLLGGLLLITWSALTATAQSLVAEPIKVTTSTISRSATNWTSQPLVQVENISTKPIKYLMIEVTLPGASAPFMLAYGQQPGRPATAGAELLNQGAKITLSVDHHTCAAIHNRLLEINASSLAGKHAAARINGVVFNDQ